jgi:hypothetical protein
MSRTYVFGVGYVEASKEIAFAYRTRRSLGDDRRTVSGRRMQQIIFIKPKRKYVRRTIPLYKPSARELKELRLSGRLGR